MMWTLKRKPMALPRLAYREELFPREAYRHCFEQALERGDERSASRLTVRLLALAHEANCEAELAEAIAEELSAGRLPDPEELEARFSRKPEPMPAVEVVRAPLNGYDALAGGPQ